MEECKEECGILYVGDLDSKVNEKILFETFKEYGKILSIRVCKDVKSKKSLGYAYVNFYKKSEAKSAMDNLNLSCINGQPCRIMWFEKDPSKRNTGFGNIIIKNVDEFTTAHEIHDIFSHFGEIKSCKIKTDESGCATGCAFVNYENDEDAERAIEAMDQNIMGENVVTVEKFYVKGQSVKEHLVTCFIENCPSNFDDNALKVFFEKFGTVVIAKIMLNEDGRSKCIGFAVFKDVDSAARATKELNGAFIEQKRIHVYRVIKKNLTSNTNLYINNLSPNITDERLRQEFQVFGKITSAKVMLSPYNKSLGYGFVCFSDREDANKAIREMNGRSLENKKIFVALNKNQAQEDEPMNTPAIVPPTNQFMNYQNVVRPVMVPFMRPVAFMQPQNTAFRFQPAPLQGPMLRPMSYPAGVVRSSVRQMFGDRLYPVVVNYARNATPYVMTQLMDMSNENLIRMIDNEAFLQYQIMTILRGSAKDSQKAESVNSENSASNITAQEVETSSEEESSDGSKSDDESSKDHKKMLCERIGSLVEKTEGKLSFNIIETLMKCDKADLFYMIENEEYLKIKVEKIKKYLVGSKTNPRIKVKHGECVKVDDTAPRDENYGIDLRAKKTLKTTSKGTHGKLQELNNELPMSTAGDSKVGPGAQKGLATDASAHHFSSDFQEKATMTHTAARAEHSSRSAGNSYLREQLIRKQQLGEKLYSLVSPHAGDMAGRVTGMFLEMDEMQVASLMADKESLKTKVDAALERIAADSA